MPQPRHVHDVTVELLAYYRSAWERIVAAEQALLEDWTAANRAGRLARLRTMQSTVEELMDRADEHALAFVNDGLPRAYMYGATASGYGGDTWTQPDIDALGVLVNDTYGNLLAATTFVRDSTKTLIRTLAREHVADKLISGQTAVQAGRDLQAAVEGEGIAAVVYSDGSRHGLAEYAQVLARTQTALAYNTGNLTRFTDAGVGFVECFDSPECGLDGHDDEEKPNGVVYPLDVMDEFSISHPNCLRSWGARPDITTAEDAAAAVGTATDAQNADQADVALSREETAVARAMSGQGVTSAPHANVLSKRAAMLAARAAKVRN